MARTGIELLPHACRIVEVAPRARLFGGGAPEPPRVTAIREIPYSAGDPEALTAELRQALKGIGRRASVAVWGLRSTHQAFLLPPAASADLEAVARREARTAPGGLPAPPLADAVVAGALRGGRRQTGYAAVAADELRARLRPLVDAGVRVESVITPALAHALVASQRRALLPDALAAVLAVNAQSTAITVVHGGVVLFARELPWGDQTDCPAGGRDPAGRAAFATRIAAELRRSLVYLRQSQNAEVSRVFVCGDFADLRSLTGPLVNELALDVETLDVVEDLDLSRLPEPSDSLRSRLGAWRTALALAVEVKPQPGLRRRDPRSGAPPSAPVRRIAAGAVAGVIVTAAGWGVMGYLWSGVTARQERLRRTIGVLEPELRRRNEARHRGAVAAAREAALAAFTSQGPRLSRIMEALSQAAPSEVAIYSLRVDPSAASWHLVIEGQAEGTDAGAAHDAFNRFLKALEASPLLGRPASPPSIRARTSDPAGAVVETVEETPTAEPAPPVQAVETPRPAPSGPAYVEVARDGRLYRIPLRRQSGNLEAGSRAEDVRRLTDAALAGRAGRVLPSGVANGVAPGRHPASLVEFTLRYEVPR